MKKIRIAQIGTSVYSHGANVIESLRKQSDIFEVVGYALPENEREKFPERMDSLEGLREMTVEEILKDETIDAVAVETEEVYLPKYALMAAQHKKHLHIEKPGGIELPDFEKLVSVVKENNLVMHLGYMYRYNPVILDLLKQVKAGEFGEITSVEAQMNCRHPAPMRAWLKNLKGGMMYFLGCHLIDLILQIQGTPENIIPLNKYSSNEEEGIVFGMAVFEYKNGVSFAKTTATEKGGFARRQLVVTGSKKTMELKPLEMWARPEGGSELYTDVTEYKEYEWKDTGITKRSEVFDRYDSMMETFAKMVRGEIENPNSPDYELELYKTVLKCCGITE